MSTERRGCYRKDVELPVEAASFGVKRVAEHIEAGSAQVLMKTDPFDAEDGEAYMYKAESFAVDLSLARRASTVLVGSVPPGVYKRLTGKISKPEDNAVVPDVVVREGPRNDPRFSEDVPGWIKGGPFGFTMRDAMRQRVTFAEPLVVGAGNEAVSVTTVHAGIDAWFIGTEGRLFDPRRENDAEVIASAIGASFRALGIER